jgi:hypothetical protein
MVPKGLRLGGRGDGGEGMEVMNEVVRCIGRG